jgi:hypothetical protein
VEAVARAPAVVQDNWTASNGSGRFFDGQAVIEEKLPSLEYCYAAMPSLNKGRRNVGSRKPQESETVLMIVIAVSMLALAGAPAELQWAVAALLATRLAKRPR